MTDSIEHHRRATTLLQRQHKLRTRIAELEAVERSLVSGINQTWAMLDPLRRNLRQIDSAIAAEFKSREES